MIKIKKIASLFLSVMIASLSGCSAFKWVLSGGIGPSMSVPYYPEDMVVVNLDNDEYVVCKKSHAMSEIGTLKGKETRKFSNGSWLGICIGDWSLGNFAWITLVSIEVPSFDYEGKEVVRFDYTDDVSDVCIAIFEKNAYVLPCSLYNGSGKKTKLNVKERIMLFKKYHEKIISNQPTYKKII